MSTNMGRVTAGLPSLSPHKRERYDIQRRTRALSDDALRLARSRESAACAEDGGVDTTDVLAQMGRPLAATEIIARLKKANSNLVFEKSLADPTKMGIYAITIGPDPVKKTGMTHKKFICGMESAFSPEFSVKHVTIEMVPDVTVQNHWTKDQKFIGETRGWRTVLARLLRAGLITPSQIDRYFNPAAGRSSRNWQTLTT